MHRFVALIWNSRSRQQVSEAPLAAHYLRSRLARWTVVLDTSGLLVLHTGDRIGQSQAYPIAGERGVVLGKLFSRKDNAIERPGNVALGELASRNIIASRGRSLIEEYWGRYVAFIRIPDDERTFVIRDPSGAIHCSRIQYSGAHLYFSHVADIQDLPSMQFTINWDYILEDSLNAELSNEMTGINEIRDVLTGECHEIVEDRYSRQFYWDPRRICREAIIDNVEEAVCAVRSETENCIDAWASTYDSVIHGLSGGLDSAIVATCLAKATRKPEILCFNFYTRTQSGDERTFARLAARKAGLPISEHRIPPISRNVGDLFAEMPLLARPYVSLFSLPLDRLHADIARVQGAQAFTSGEGGDHIFIEPPSEMCAADYAFVHGFDRRLLKIVFDNARMLKISFWTVLKAAARFGLMHHAKDPAAGYSFSSHAFIKQEAINSRPPYFADHPWSLELNGVPNAKAGQLFNLPKVLNRYPSFGRCETSDVIHPLLSQPLVEVCLRTPTYLLALDGQSRGLARRAFADAIPHAILYRKSKGDTASELGRKLAENLDFLREFVLDGVLAKQAFVDRNRLDKTLSIDGIGHLENYYAILKGVAAEAWLRRWVHICQKVAA